MDGTRGAGLLCVLVLVGGLFDQTTKNDVPPYKALKAEHDSICRFVAALERTLPPGAMVLQLPFIHFPEANPINHMGDSDHLRMYLNSHTLHWSHGTVKGRYGSDVLSLLCAAPIEETLERFAAMGYQGIHIDRRGYADNGQAMEARLSALTRVSAGGQRRRPRCILRRSALRRARQEPLYGVSMGPKARWALAPWCPAPG